MLWDLSWLKNPWITWALCYSICLIVFRTGSYFYRLCGWGVLEWINQLSLLYAPTVNSNEFMLRQIMIRFMWSFKSCFGSLSSYGHYQIISHRFILLLTVSWLVSTEDPIIIFSPILLHCPLSTVRQVFFIWIHVVGLAELLLFGYLLWIIECGQCIYITSTCCLCWSLACFLKPCFCDLLRAWMKPIIF